MNKKPYELNLGLAKYGRNYQLWDLDSPEVIDISYKGQGNSYHKERFEDFKQQLKLQDADIAEEGNFRAITYAALKRITATLDQSQLCQDGIIAEGIIIGVDQEKGKFTKEKLVETLDALGLVQVEVPKYLNPDALDFEASALETFNILGLQRGEEYRVAHNLR
jgi:hypothetical protein